MRKKRMVSIISAAGVLVIAFLAILAYLIFGGSKEPKADYSALVHKVAGSKERILSFVSLEPGGIHHTGDPVVLRFGVAYDPSQWEVPDDELRRASPLPDVFELRERKFRTVKLNNFMVFEAKLRAQCFECRDKTYYLDLPSLRIKNKETGDVTSVHFDTETSLPKIQFAPLTTGDYAPDENGLIVLKIKNGEYKKAALLAFAALAFSVSMAFLGWNFFLRYRISKRGQKAHDVTSPYLLRVQELQLALQSSDADSIAHSLYAVVSLLKEARADPSGVLQGARQELAAVYTESGIEKEQIAIVLGRLEAFLKARGEV